MQMKKDNIILVDNDIVKEINYFNKSLGNKTIEELKEIIKDFYE